MTQIKKSFGLLILAGSLAACGSGSGDLPTTITDANGDNLPVFTSPLGSSLSKDVAENSTEVITLAATDADGEAVAFAVNGGMDAAFFEIGAKANTLSFKAAPNFEDPKDDGKNNSYLVNITATAGKASVDALLTVNVTDVAELKRPLNDTGITLCGNTANDSNIATCDSSVPQGQDGFYGRDADASLSKKGAGAAGFDFTKLGSDGSVLASQSATDHHCVQDNHTGLVWEVKTTANKDSRYTWYNPVAATNGGNAGTDSANDTLSYTQSVNTAGLCDANDWRLPTLEELVSIVHLGKPALTIDSMYFPQAMSDFYWASSPFAAYANSAWTVSFADGRNGGDSKSSTYSVRLVRAGQ